MTLFLYRLLIYFLLPFLAVRFVLKGIRNPDYFNRIGERFGFTAIQPPKGGFWIHAVSVGEVNAALPLIYQLNNKWPGLSIVITTMTTTGSDRVRKVLGENVYHCYLPYDYPGAVKRFIERIQPQLGMVMETEIWPNLITQCHTKNIPLVYTNVRLSQRSWRGYNRFRRLFSAVLPKVSQFAVQSEADAKRLIQLGAPEQHVNVTGSIKFDISLPPSLGEAGESIRRQLGWNRPVFLAASTHDGEEAAAIEAFAEIRTQLPETLLILVPRHPERFSQVIRLCEKSGLNTRIRSNMMGTSFDNVDALVVDTMGELTMFVAAADVTFMGGSLVPVGGHNLLEVASLKKPVIFGPHMFNFAEISELFLQQGAGIQVQHTSELAEVVIRLLDDAAMRDRFGNEGVKLMEQNRGALDRVINLITAEMV